MPVDNRLGLAKEKATMPLNLTSNETRYNTGTLLQFRRQIHAGRDVREGAQFGEQHAHKSMENV